MSESKIDDKNLYFQNQSVKNKNSRVYKSIHEDVKRRWSGFTKDMKIIEIKSLILPQTLDKLPGIRLNFSYDQAFFVEELIPKSGIYETIRHSASKIDILNVNYAGTDRRTKYWYMKNNSGNLKKSYYKSTSKNAPILYTYTRDWAFSDNNQANRIMFFVPSNSVSGGIGTYYMVQMVKCFIIKYNVNGKTRIEWLPYYNVYKCVNSYERNDFPWFSNSWTPPILNESDNKTWVYNLKLSRKFNQSRISREDKWSDGHHNFKFFLD